MNKLFLLVGLLSAGVAMGQTKAKTTKMSSTTTSTSSYNNSNTNNYNSQNATSGTNSSTNGTSTSGSMNGTTGSSNTNGTGTSAGSTGSMSSMGTTGSSTGTYDTNMGSTTASMGTTGSTTGDMNSSGTTGNTTNGTYNNSTSVTPSGTSNYNTTTDTNGATTTTPSTSGNYNSAGSTYSTATTTSTAYPSEKKDYKNFSYAIYAGLNTTKFQGESFDANGAASGLTGRLGYQLGFFVRGGGRLYGQIGAEYFASSSNYFTTAPGSGTTTATSIRDRIDIKYIQVPVYIGYKLTQSDRGLSAVRVQVGVEYANQIGSTANQFGNLNNFQLKNGTFNGLGQLGFDAGPVFLDLTYHYGFSDAIQQNTGFAGSKRRILSASVGFKF
ncbi:PorT family protein [Fibrella aquatilis]|nr:PorT family protein [Fibrella aquatilis]